MATLRDIKEFIADIESRPSEGRTITKDDFASVLQSLAKVAGSMALSSPSDTAPVEAGWNRIDVFDTSRDTQGVKDGLADPTDPGGWFKINAAAAGDYTCSAMLRFISDTDGLFQLRVSQVDAQGAETTTPWQDAVTVSAGETAQLNIASGLVKNVANNERLQLSVKGPNGAVVTALYAQFGIQR